MSSITELVERYADVRASRLMLEEKAKELKEGPELDLKNAILQEMMAQGLKSAHVEGKGRVVCRETSHYEIQDINALCTQMLKSMVEAGQAGRPLADGLLFQKRIHAENLSSYVGDNDENLVAFGVKKVVKVDLSLTKV